MILPQTNSIDKMLFWVAKVERDFPNRHSCGGEEGLDIASLPSLWSMECANQKRALHIFLAPIQLNAQNKSQRSINSFGQQTKPRRHLTRKLGAEKSTWAASSNSMKYSVSDIFGVRAPKGVGQGTPDSTILVTGHESKSSPI